MDESTQSGRYQRLHALGRGAMGEVWLAEDTLLHRNVALKTVASYGPPSELDTSRIMREAQLAARLNHPNAVAVYDVFVENGRPCVVMEYVAGKTLADRIAEVGRLPADEVARIGRAVADALAEAHRLGIVHRDLKPANILITERGTPKLADFGIAHGLDATATATGLAIGTPAYLAPELARGGKADTRSDVWALGVTLFAALDGRSPFAGPGDDAIAVIGRIATAQHVPSPQHGETLTRTVLAAMSIDPAARPPADALADMMRTDVSALATSEHSAAKPLPLQQPPQPPPQSAPMPSSEWTVPLHTGAAPDGRRTAAAVIAVMVVLVVAVAGIGVWLLTRPHGNSPQAGGSSNAPTSDSPRPTPTPTKSAIKGKPYSAAGVEVTGPKGWTEDDSADIVNVKDFVGPGENRDSGTYFRIGIGNPRPAATIQSEAKNAIGFLNSKNDTYDKVKITSEKFVKSFLGKPAVDIEYTGTNGRHIERRVRERLWIAGGVTREIIVNAPAADWSEREPLFTMLVDSARISE